MNARRTSLAASVVAGGEPPATVFGDDEDGVPAGVAVIVGASVEDDLEPGETAVTIGLPPVLVDRPGPGP